MKIYIQQTILALRGAEVSRALPTFMTRIKFTKIFHKIKSRIGITGLKCLLPNHVKGSLISESFVQSTATKF